MKVLIVSAYFPPGNAIGAVRLGKLARHLTDSGCEVRVICAIDETLPQTLPVEIDTNNVIQTKWVDLHSLPRKVLRRRLAQSGASAAHTASSSRLMGVAYDLFRAIFHWPDRHVAWFFPAIKSGRKLIVDWKPDVIYASAWPITSLLVGAALSREFSIPWIAELRDLWLDNHYYRVPFWRRWIDRVVEKRLLTSAALLVTVSEPLAEILEQKFCRPTKVVLNGFDPADVALVDHPRQKDILTISYTGMIYPGRRDPRPLFEALKLIGPLAKRVRVRFYGRILPGVQALIESYGLEDCVEIYAPVPYREALKIQSESDILLLLMWDIPEERGVYTGKLFEYLGARRPILSLGLEYGVAADLIRERAAGIVTNDSKCVAQALTQWISEKELQGQVAPLDNSVTKGLSRAEQFDRLLPAMRSVAEAGLRKRKVVVVTRKLDVGGSERHLIQILPRLIHKFDVSVFVVHSGGELEKELSDVGVSVNGPPNKLGPLLSRFWAALWLTLFFLKNRKAVVHFFLPEAYLIGGCCGAVLRHPRMLMSRRSLNIYQNGYPLLAFVEKLLHRKMRYVVGNSQAVVKNLLAEGVSASRSRLIYNGVNFEGSVGHSSNRDRLRAEYGIKDDDLVIMTVANLIPYKGHEDLIRALGEIASFMPVQWRLLLIGRDDGIQGKLQKLAHSLGLTDRVIFVGQIKLASTLWQMGDIGVQPSHQEGFSNSILEGMAAGLPMIVTDVGGNAEAVLHEMTGLVVSPHAPSELGTALLALASDAEKRKVYGEAGQMRAKELFSEDACVKSYENMYASIFNNA